MRTRLPACTCAAAAADGRAQEAQTCRECAPPPAWYLGRGRRCSESVRHRAGHDQPLALRHDLGGRDPSPHGPCKTTPPLVRQAAQEIRQEHCVRLGPPASPRDADTHAGRCCDAGKAHAARIRGDPPECSTPIADRQRAGPPPASIRPKTGRETARYGGDGGSAWAECGSDTHCCFVSPGAWQVRGLTGNPQQIYECYGEGLRDAERGLCNVGPGPDRPNTHAVQSTHRPSHESTPHAWPIRHAFL